MVFLDNGLVFSIEQRYGLLLVTREMLVFPHLIIINMISVQIAFLTFVVCGKIKSTANLDILQFWCGFCVIKSATVAFSLVYIKLATLIESGHLHFITLCFVHLLDFRVSLWARGNLLCLHVKCNFCVLLILQSFVLTYVNLIKSGLWFFLLWLRLDQIVLFHLSPTIHAKHFAKHILIVQHIWRRSTYDSFRCLLIHFALALLLRLFWSVNFGLHDSDLWFY